MKTKTKRFTLIFLVILSGIFCLGMGSAQANGMSSGGSSPMIRASIPAPTRPVITLSNSMTGGTGYTVTPNTVDLTDVNEVYFITGTTNTYGINALVDCTIILDNVSISSSALSTAGIELNGNNVTITLNTGSNNTITATSGEPAIHCTNPSTLILNGDGTLLADSSSSVMCAGIGGRVIEDGGVITISENAAVTATGDIQASGIGGGEQGNGGIVTIKDSATVIATGGSAGGAGIGGGPNMPGPLGTTGNGGTVTIEGTSTVIATGGSSGIGSGINGNGGSVTIKDSAVVTATTTGGAGSGIGSGGVIVPGMPSSGTINISGGTVTALGHVGIGGGTGNINLSGGVIRATGTGSVGIGDNNTATVTVTGGTITTQGGTSENGIDGAAVTISGGNLLSKDGSSASPSSSIFSTTTTNVYQSILTVPGITSSQPITAFSTTDGVSYLINGSTTITDGTQEVLTVWLPSTTTPQTIYVTIGGINYEATYVRPNTGIAQMLTISAVAPTNVAVTGVTLDKSAFSLLQNSMETITATVQPTNATDQRVLWNSSDTNIATVDAAGVVTGKNVGTATITATTNDGSYIANCVVTVTTTSTSSSSTSSSGTSSSGAASSNTPAGGTTNPGGNTGGTNNSKEFWYPNSSGTQNSSSANGGSATVPNSPNYNPVTGGETGTTPVFFGSTIIALLSSLGVVLIKRKK